MLSFPYPAPVLLSETDLGAQAVPGDRLSSWDPNGNGGVGGWQTTLMVAFPPPAHWAEDITLEVGRGYFYYRSGTTTDIVESKPYAEP